MKAWAGAYVDVSVSGHQAFVEDQCDPMRGATICGGICHDSCNGLSVFAITNDWACHGLNQCAPIAKANERTVEVALNLMVQVVQSRV